MVSEAPLPWASTPAAPVRLLKRLPKRMRLDTATDTPAASKPAAAILPLAGVQRTTAPAGPGETIDGEYSRFTELDTVPAPVDLAAADRDLEETARTVAPTTGKDPPDPHGAAQDGLVKVAGDGDRDGEEARERLGEWPPKLEVPGRPPGDEASAGSGKTSSDDGDDEDRRTGSDELPTTPLTAASSEPKLTTELAADKGPHHFDLFGQAGQDTLKYLPSYGLDLYGGLDLGSDAEPLGGSNASAGAHGHHHHHDDDGEDDDEFGPEGGHCHHHHCCHHHHEDSPPYVSTGFVSGGNKKKRKVPGLMGERGYEGLPGDAEPGVDTCSNCHDIIEHGGGSEEETAHGTVIPKDLPRTAKAALAKLDPRTAHTSRSPNTASFRRHRRLMYRRRGALHLPLILTPVTTPFFYSPPAKLSSGPPPLPPGSGLKGSKALKAAKKAEKERERERERINTALGAGTIKLPFLFDPLGLEKKHPRTNKLPASIPRYKQRAVFKLGLPTPPPSNSSDEGDEAHKELGLPQLDQLEFTVAAPETINLRWTSLQQALTRLKAARLRVAEAEKELEKQKKAAAAAEAQLNAEKAKIAPAAPPASTAKKDNKALPPSKPVKAPAAPLAPAPAPAAHSRPPVATTPLPSAPTPVEPATPALNTPTITEDQVEPVPAVPKKPPLKKGKKKRSAHANANNHHHRDNYIPSRAPASAAGHAPWERPKMFEDGPPSSFELPRLPAFSGPDEDLCAFCEYELYYGEPSLFAMAVKKRKSVLKVRRKARERAAKATAGKAAPPPPPAAPATEAAAAETSSAAAPPPAASTAVPPAAAS